MPKFISRRQTLIALTGLATFGMTMPTLALSQLEDVKDLKPGEWNWFPERATLGPVAVVISLSDQLAFVYRNGIRIGVSTISSGKKGYTTPSGVFTVLRKERMHHSHKYHNAAMPDSQFFFRGAALHAGGLPGYPSSHGCVHLPRAFADKLFAVTHNGTPVIITKQHSAVGSLSHAGLLLANLDLQEVEKLTGNVRSKTLPVDKDGYSKDAFSVVVSAADRKVFGFLNGEVLFESDVRISGHGPVGEHVFVLRGAHDGRQHLEWVAVGMGAEHEGRFNQHSELAKAGRVHIPHKIRNKISYNLHPGSTFVITELPAHPSTRIGGDFTVMRVEPGK